MKKQIALAMACALCMLFSCEDNLSMNETRQQDPVTSMTMNDGSSALPGPAEGVVVAPADECDDCPDDDIKCRCEKCNVDCGAFTQIPYQIMRSAIKGKICGNDWFGCNEFLKNLRASFVISRYPGIKEVAIVDYKGQVLQELDHFYSKKLGFTIIPMKNISPNLVGYKMGIMITREVNFKGKMLERSTVSPFFKFQDYQ